MSKTFVGISAVVPEVTEDDAMIKTPMLDFLQENRIMHLRRGKNNETYATDGCDDWFGVVLTPDDLRTLASELTAAADEADKRE